MTKLEEIEIKCNAYLDVLKEEIKYWEMNPDVSTSYKVSKIESLKRSIKLIGNIERIAKD